MYLSHSEEHEENQLHIEILSGFLSPKNKQIQIHFVFIECPRFNYFSKFDEYTGADPEEKLRPNSFVPKFNRPYQW